MKTPQELYKQHKDYYMRNPDVVPPETWPVGDGWQQLITDALNKIEETSPDFYIDQIKEKFGGLRLYIGNLQTDEDSKTIDVAEEASYSICEECGAPGVADAGRGWVKTLCEEDRVRREQYYLDMIEEQREKYNEQG